MSQESYVFCLPKRETNNDEDDWDRYSENIRPTRRGRKIEALKRVEVVTDATARQKMEELIEKLKKEPEIDELSEILNFCGWFEDKFAIGNQKLFYELLWKAISREGFLKKFEEDERMLKIWEKMADNSAGHAHDIYQYAISRNSLLRSAALYVRWSQCVELAGAFVEARRVLILAKTNCAMPLELINNAEDQLEMREMRRHMEQRDSDDDLDDDEETRQAFTNLPVIGEKHAVPVVRLPSLVADTTKKAMKFDTGNMERIRIAGTLNEMQPFEVLPYADADDVEYLKSVHELNPHIERYAFKETNNPQVQMLATTTETLKMTAGDAEFEVWTVEGSSTGGGATKPKARMAIKKIFRDMSFEEYAASLLPDRHPSVKCEVVKKLDFDETL